MGATADRVPPSSTPAANTDAGRREQVGRDETGRRHDLPGDDDERGQQEPADDAHRRTVPGMPRAHLRACRDSANGIESILRVRGHHHALVGEDHSPPTAFSANVASTIESSALSTESLPPCDVTGVDEHRGDLLEHRDLVGAGDAAHVEVRALGDDGLRDLEVDAGDLGEQRRRLVGVLESPLARLLVGVDDGLREVGVVLDEVLGRVEESVGVEVDVAVDELVARLHLGRGHDRVEARPGVAPSRRRALRARRRAGGSAPRRHRPRGRPLRGTAAGRSRGRCPWSRRPTCPRGPRPR